MTHVLKSLDQMAQEVYRVELSLFYKTDEFYNEIHVDHKISRRHGKQIVLQVREHCGENGGQEIAVGSIRDGLIKAKGMLTGHEFVIDSLLLLGLDEGDAEIFRAARAEIASILGCSTDSLTQLMTHDEVLSFRAGLLRDALFGILTSGPDGIEAWNSRSSSEFHDAGNDFQGHSVANLDLSEARFEHQDWNKANFDACVLTGCRFGDARISKASFRGADLEGANLSGAEANYADFTGATLSNIFAYEASFKGCKFNNSNLTSAKFDKCDFRAADLREATLKESRFSGCVIDEKTAFDSG